MSLTEKDLEKIKNIVHLEVRLAISDLLMAIHDEAMKIASKGNDKK